MPTADSFAGSIDKRQSNTKTWIAISYSHYTIQIQTSSVMNIYRDWHICKEKIKLTKYSQLLISVFAFLTKINKVLKIMWFKFFTQNSKQLEFQLKTVCELLVSRFSLLCKNSRGKHSKQFSGKGDMHPCSITCLLITNSNLMHPFPTMYGAQQVLVWQ